MGISANTYQEVYEILSYMDKIIVMKIPEDILNIIVNRRNKEYITKIDKNDIFNLYNISKETIEILCWIDVNFWMDKEKKDRLKRKYEEKLISEEKLKREKYNPDNFLKKNIERKQEIISNETSMVIYKESIIQKLINKLKKIFR